MNKTITAAYDAAKQNHTEENIKALKALAVPKFKEVYGRVQKSIRTINRHLGVNKGNPNRATLATAIGLKDELNAFVGVATLINMPEMVNAANGALIAVDTMETMRKTRQYDHMDVMVDFLTNEELLINKANDAKIYLANINRAARAAIDTINRHIVDGTFDVNTFTIAKVVGYVDEMTNLRADLNAFTTITETTEIVTADDVVACDKTDTAIGEILVSKQNGYRTAVAALGEYIPDADEDDAEQELCETEAE